MLAVVAIFTIKVDWLVANSATMGPKLSALVGLLDSAFPSSFSKTQALLDQLLGLQISRWTIATIRLRGARLADSCCLHDVSNCFLN